MMESSATDCAELVTRILGHAEQYGGTLGIGFSEEWIVGYEFGQESGASPMVGGAAYSGSKYLREALESVLGQVGLDKPQDG